MFSRRESSGANAGCIDISLFGFVASSCHEAGPFFRSTPRPKLAGLLLPSLSAGRTLQRHAQHMNAVKQGLRFCTQLAKRPAFHDLTLQRAMDFRLGTLSEALPSCSGRLCSGHLEHSKGFPVHPRRWRQPGPRQNCSAAAAPLPEHGGGRSLCRGGGGVPAPTDSVTFRRCRTAAAAQAVEVEPLSQDQTYDNGRVVKASALTPAGSPDSHSANAPEPFLDSHCHT